MSTSKSSPSAGSAVTAVGTSSESKQMLWFTISGWIGTALFMVVYEWMHSYASDRPLSGVDAFDALEWSTVAWTASYILSILWQHALHRHLVFGTASPYLSSLMWTYFSYTLSIVLSFFINMGCSYIGMHHRVSFVLTLVLTGLLNFHTLKNAFQPPADVKSK